MAVAFSTIFLSSNLFEISYFRFIIYYLSAYKTTTILLDGKRVKLQLWDTSGQGRFCTIIRSYSRGAQGILLVYDITNKWSFDGIDRWLKEVEEVSDGIYNFPITILLHITRIAQKYFDQFKIV